MMMRSTTFRAASVMAPQAGDSIISGVNQIQNSPSGGALDFSHLREPTHPFLRALPECCSFGRFAIRRPPNKQRIHGQRSIVQAMETAGRWRLMVATTRFPAVVAD